MSSEPSRHLFLERVRAGSCLLGLLLAGHATLAFAWVDLQHDLYDPRVGADGIHVLDGSYVMNAGDLHVNITNFGLIGSQYSVITTYSDAPSAQWPGGSGVEYLWAAGLWVGGIKLGQQVVSTGQYEAEFRPADNLADTIYEARKGRITRPSVHDATGARPPDLDADDDGDGKVDEETLNGYDDDGDGLIDEDFGQIANQMMVCTMYDNTPLAQEMYSDHEPLDLKVVMKAYAWEDELLHDFVALDFWITNVGSSEIDDVFVGLFADCDIGRRGEEDEERDDLAGYYEGQVRASDGSFQQVSVAYMYDVEADEDASVSGYFGIMFLGSGLSTFSQIRSFQSFAGQQPYITGGDPTNDAERYELMSRAEIDPDTLPGDENDYRFLAATGPRSALRPGGTLRFQAALVVGDGLEGLLRTCGEAARTRFGSYWDLDHDPETGVGGKETYTCKEWHPINPQTGKNDIYSHPADYWNLSCVTEGMPLDLITDDDMVEDFLGNHCLWVNMDNCEECVRQSPGKCTGDNVYHALYWNCNDTSLPAGARIGCTGILGRESQLPWQVGGLAPSAPHLRLWPTDNAVHVFWDDHSEHDRDLFLDLVDFESYRVWRADGWERPFGSSLENGPASDLWRLVAEYDLVNYYYVEHELQDGTVAVDTLPFGYNTGFDGIRYRPICLDDARFAGLAEAMQEVVHRDSLGEYETRPYLRDRYGDVVPGLEGLLPWGGHPAVLDTFFQVTPREANPETGAVGKRAIQFYEHIDHNIHNGFLYFYSVTARDHAIEYEGSEPHISGGGQTGHPSASFDFAVPSFAAQTAAQRRREGVNIFVYPNPATPQTLAEFQQLHPNADDPTGRRIMFANLPRARNRIQIFTLDGDLVAEVDHDGTSGHGQVSWNLVSLNGQQVVSGLYLYVVQSNDRRFEDFIGKFVVIR